MLTFANLWTVRRITEGVPSAHIESSVVAKSLSDSYRNTKLTHALSIKLSVTRFRTLFTEALELLHIVS